jgi:hypothetical protein
MTVSESLDFVMSFDFERGIGILELGKEGKGC